MARQIRVYRVSRRGAVLFKSDFAFVGQDLFTKAAKGDIAALHNMDRQIFRLIGKATTLAACVSTVVTPLSVTCFDRNRTCSMAYRVRQGRDFVVPPTGMNYTES